MVEEMVCHLRKEVKIKVLTKMRKRWCQRVRGGSLGGIRRSGTKVKKMIMKMVKMVRMKTIYLGGSGLKK
ncbi:hypothetical protein Tco_0719833 [Tanacetum coccineum]